MNARKIFCWALLGGTFFLTGCAGQRYHTQSGQPVQETRTIHLMQAVPRFDWPLSGRVTVPYGSKEDGVSSRGIVVEGSEGQPVRAAGDGKVVYIDEGMRGYGRTVILEHSGDFSTVYARNAEILVVLGQWVKRGQTIAKIGRAGKGATPQSYFEIRRSARSEDPLQYLH